LHDRRIGELLEGRSDDEISAFVKELGIDNLLDQVRGAIVERFSAEKAAGQSATIQWDVTDADGVHSFHIIVADGTCTSAMGAADSARVTLGFGVPAFLKFLAGKLDGMQAFMGGQLKLTGDMMFAQQMQAWFPTS
jgi:putative sterol carrier protein